MHVILLHGLGRTQLSMLALRRRLNAWGHRAHLFGYVPTFESMEGATARLVRFTARSADGAPYVFVGHSLGSVLARNAYPKLAKCPPAACYWLAPPVAACRAAKYFSRFMLYRWLAGEMGRLLADEEFMRGLSLPPNSKIYAGTGGFRRRWLPFGGEPNDGILSLAEASCETGAQVVRVPAMHTFIMNSKDVCADLKESLRMLG